MKKRVEGVMVRAKEEGSRGYHKEGVRNAARRVIMRGKG